jgi:alpha-D-ribose 1-methylphosphonate 5-triphosphate synthase subunit PhnH
MATNAEEIKENLKTWTKARVANQVEVVERELMALVKDIAQMNDLQKVVGERNFSKQVSTFIIQLKTFQEQLNND